MGDAVEDDSVDNGVAGLTADGLTIEGEPRRSERELEDDVAVGRGVEERAGVIGVGMDTRR